MSAPWDPVLERAAGSVDDPLVHRRTIPGRRADAVPLEGLDSRLGEALAAAGIGSLYRHQADALHAARKGRHVVIATGTASGKSLAFGLPVLDAIARDRDTRALYVYPTKALARDQARALTRLRPPNLRAAIYDGDTPRGERSQIRSWANLILTNPDMLHTGMLPAHSRWADTLARLRYVVVDEAHTYRGVFGSHVANVLARLRRLARAYGAEPTFLLASATIANPAAAAEVLVGAGVDVVDNDGAPAPARDIAIWNPPLLDPELGLRASASGEAALLLAELVAREQRTIVFAKSRRACELIYRYTRERLDRQAPELADRIAPYRAGYTPEQRREIERGLVEGGLLGVVATSALELGVDIGLLDCAVTVGFPGSVSSLRQQWGRAGRRGHGLGVMIAGSDALDQYFARHADELLDRTPECAVSNPGNPAVLTGHLRCAAAELPLTDENAREFGADGLTLAASLPELIRTPAGLAYRGADHPAAQVSLRSAGADAVGVVEAKSGTLVGIVDGARADSTVHPGAVYLHMGVQHLVTATEPGAQIAFVEPFAGDYYTQAVSRSQTEIVRELETRSVAGALVAFGDIEVREQVLGYQRKRLSDHKPIDQLPLDSPERCFQTQAVWFVPRRARRASVAGGPPRRRALDDRPVAPPGHSRPGRHRRPLDRRPSPDRPADGVRVRRLPRWSRDRPPGLRPLPGVGRANGPAARRVPVRTGMPVVRPVAEVRQPERAALEVRRPCPAACNDDPPGASRSVRLMGRSCMPSAWYDRAPRAEKGSRCESGAVPPL